MHTYTVIGIIQTSGRETPIRVTVRAESPEQAKAKVLADFEATEQMWARWYSPERVRCQKHLS